MVFSDSVSNPIKFHVYCSRYFCFSIPLTMVFVAVLFVATGVGGCWWPIYAKVVLMDVHFWKFSNRPPNSASVDNSITLFIILHYTWTGSFSGGISCIGVLDFGTRKIFSGSTSYLWFWYVVCIWVNVENHSTFSLFCYFVCMCCAVTKKFSYSFWSFNFRLCLHLRQVA